MKICPRPDCQTLHDRPGTYCSRKCANVRIWTKADKLKKSMANKDYWNTCSEEKKDQHRLNAIKNGKVNADRTYNSVITSNFDSLSYNKKRWRVLIEQDYKCKECGLSEWRGKPLVLELEHKNGNHSDNSRNNLECLCPNCHSLTPSWRGRNNEKTKKNWRDNINTKRDSLPSSNGRVIGR